MTDPKGSNRIPFEEIDSSTSAWNFPTWENGANKVVSAVKKKTVPQENKSHTRVEEVSNHPAEPITAQQLQKIHEDAEKEGRELGYKTGYEKGFAEGEKKGLLLGEQKAHKEVKQKLDEQRDRFRSMTDALLDPVAMQDHQLENTILDMAVHIAKHLINQELSTDPTSLFLVVQRAAASLPAGAQNIRIYLHADDVELAHEAFSNSGRDWTFFSDGNLSRGGCRIETNHSLIDYSIEKRLKDMLEQIRFQGDIDPDTLAPIDDYYREDLIPDPIDPIIDDGGDDYTQDDESTNALDDIRSLDGRDDNAERAGFDENLNDLDDDLDVDIDSSQAIRDAKTSVIQSVAPAPLFTELEDDQWEKDHE